MWHTKNTYETERILNTNIPKGLTNQEVQKRQEKQGKNKLKEKKKENIIIRFIKQFNDFMIIILIIASIISAAVSYMQGQNDYIDSIIIIAIVVLNAIMGLIQEERAEKSIESLKKLTPQIAKVIRDGETKEILAEELVQGDIIELSDGNYVPADCRIIEEFNLKIEESSLTGETEPVTKTNQVINKEDIPLGDMKNMAFMASIVVSGRGKAIVTEIGMNTKIGQIANMIIEDEAPETPIQKKLGEVGKILGIVCLAICAIIFIIGIIKKIEPVEMFMTSVGLAVAAIPEGLPAIVTIMLSIGVTKMAKKNAIIRKLPAVETLGSSNVICSDKTGTLTQNKMTVVKTISSNSRLLLELGSMCTDCIIKNDENGRLVASGEPTEAAIVNKALNENINKDRLYKENQRISELPFESNRKMMTTIHKKQNGGYISITKGAPDILIGKCNRIYENRKIENLTQSKMEEIKKQNENMADEALRVIAVGYKELDYFGKANYELEEKLIFVGLIGMIDPPRDGVKEAVETCQKAGIKTVMITGDHIATAKAIAKDLGILKTGEKAITGNELNKISDEELERNIASYSVFARVTPEHKVRIVKAWQKQGKVVAMTGDGVNDSPALKRADVGFGMQGGSDVAKEASDIVLTDDNFASVVKAVELGRTFMHNIMMFLEFQLPINISLLILSVIYPMIATGALLASVQILIVNIIMDSLNSLSFGGEPPKDEYMTEKPIKKGSGLFIRGAKKRIAISTVAFIVLYGIITFSPIANMFATDTEAMTARFALLCFMAVFNGFNIRTEHINLFNGIGKNKLFSAIAIGIFVMTFALCNFAENLVKVTALDFKHWVVVVILAFMVIPIDLIRKIIEKKRENK